MKTLESSLVAVAAVLAAVSSPGSARADTVNFSSLPVVQAGSPAAPRSTATGPEAIAATEHVAGVFVALPPEDDRKRYEDRGYRVVNVFSSERAARAFTAGEMTSESAFDEPSGSRTCLIGERGVSQYLELYYERTPPNPSKATIAVLTRQGRWPLPKAPHTAPFRTERLTKAGDGVTLETVDAYVDLETLGTRVVSTSTTKLKLARIATGPNDLGVYAGRHENGGAELLVTAPELPTTGSDRDRTDRARELSTAARRLALEIPSGVSSQTGCGYTSFTLTAKPGSGQMATVIGTAFLPPARDTEDPGDAAAQLVGDDADAETLARVRESLRRERRSQRARTVAVHVSLSQMESEPAPLLSVTFGWAGKDQQLRF